MKKRRYAFLSLTAIILLVLFLVHAPAQKQLSFAEPEPEFVGMTSSKSVVRLAAIGDTRSGDSRQAQLGEMLDAINQKAPLDGIILLGDNAPLLGNPAHALKKAFLTPYASLIEQQIPFFASLGNHDLRSGMKQYQLSFSQFNMNGPYYSKVFGDNTVQVFFIDSNSIKEDKPQRQWLEEELEKSDTQWKVVAMHHPLYATAMHHPPDISLRKLLEPVLIENKVDVVLSGHNHVYERLHPINGIVYITAGSGGKLSRNDLPTDNPLRAAGNDTDNVALLLEFTDEVCRFSATASDGRLVDEGTLRHALVGTR